MKIEEFNPETMYKCAATIRSLGNGRKFNKVLVGDSDDARTAHFYYVGNICHNWPSWKLLNIQVGDRLKRLEIPKPTIKEKPAYIFFWNELTADLWFRQLERQKILEWFKTAEEEDGIALAELIFEEAGSEHRVIVHPLCPQWSFQWITRQVQIEMRKLDLPSLRKLTGLIEPDSQRVVEPAKAA